MLPKRVARFKSTDKRPRHVLVEWSNTSCGQRPTYVAKFVDAPEALEKWFGSVGAPYLFFDAEWSPYRPRARIGLLQLRAPNTNEVIVVDCVRRSRRIWSVVRDICTKTPLIGFSIGGDLNKLYAEGVYPCKTIDLQAVAQAQMPNVLAASSGRSKPNYSLVDTLHACNCPMSEDLSHRKRSTRESVQWSDPYIRLNPNDIRYAAMDVMAVESIFSTLNKML